LNFKNILLSTRFRTMFFSSALAIGIVTYIILSLNFFNGEKVLVSDIDEIPYYHSAKAFSDYNSLKASVFIEENVSKKLECDWYGPGYPLVFGSLRKIFGGNDKAFIIANLLFLLIIGWMILKKFDLSKDNKIWLFSTLLIVPSVLNNAFYFMPVIFDLLSATLLLLFLQRINVTNQNKKELTKMLIAYILLSLFISFFKQNFIFFSFAVLAFSKNKKQFFAYLSLVFIAFFVTMIYGTYFLAPAYAKSLKTISYLLSFDLKMFFASLWATVHTNLTIIYQGLMHPASESIPGIYKPVYFFNIIMPVVAAFYALRSKNKMILAASLISFISLVFFICLYTLYWNFFTRITTPLVLVNMYLLILIFDKYKTMVQFAVVILFLSILPFTYKFVKEKQEQKKSCYNKVEKIKPGFEAIKNYITENKIHTILFDRDFYNHYEIETIILALPMASEQGDRLRYSVNLSMEDRFTLHNKLKVDYVVTPAPAQFSYPNALVGQNNYFYLYKLN